MSLYDDAKADLADILGAEDFGRSAIFNGVEIAIILTKDFSEVSFDLVNIESAECLAYVAASDVVGITHGSPIQIKDDQGNFISYSVTGKQEMEAGMIVLLLTRAS